MVWDGGLERSRIKCMELGCEERRESEKTRLRDARDNNRAELQIGQWALSTHPPSLQ
jgi:hypothetical protein